eukprot:g923.t1
MEVRLSGPATYKITKSIAMVSNMTLRIGKNTTLFSDRPICDPHRGKDSCVQNPRCPTLQWPSGPTAILCGTNLTNVAIVGDEDLSSTIDGGGWLWYEAGLANASMQGVGPRTYELAWSSNLSISTVRFVNSPSWTVHPTFSTNVRADRIEIQNPRFTPNTDGFDPDSCVGVVLSNSHIDTGDDGISLKSMNSTVVGSTHKMRREAEEKAKKDEERRALREAERKALEAAQSKARAEAERKAREDEARALEAAQNKARAEAERKAREDEARALEAVQNKARAEAERKAREDEARALEAAQNKARAEAERKAREDEARALEVAQNKARAAAERKAREDEARALEAAVAAAAAAAASKTTSDDSDPNASFPPSAPGLDGGITSGVAGLSMDDGARPKSSSIPGPNSNARGPPAPPSSSSSSTTQTMQLRVTIPGHVGPGDTFQIRTPAGTVMNVVVPVGKYGGQALVVSVPISSDSTAPNSTTARPHPPRPTASVPTTTKATSVRVSFPVARLGVEFHNGLVTRLEPQAAQVGVRLGDCFWKIGGIDFRIQTQAGMRVLTCPPGKRPGDRVMYQL